MRIEVIEFVQTIEFLYRTLVTPGVVFFGLKLYGYCVQALPDPEPGDGKWYRFFFGLAHLLADNVNLTKKAWKRPTQGWS